MTGDEQIRILNRDYRKKDKATDVLAFALREGEFGAINGGLLGDVIVSLPTAQRQAAEQGKPLLDETTMLLAHGLLHLLAGTTRRPPRTARCARRRTASLLPPSLQLPLEEEERDLLRLLNRGFHRAYT